MKKRRRFIHRNERFTCSECQQINTPLAKTCRNHCIKCLSSRHVDLEVPGDRKNSCGSLMKAIFLDYSPKKGNMILHECTRCKKRTRNMAATDDHFESLLLLSHAVISPHRE